MAMKGKDARSGSGRTIGKMIRASYGASVKASSSAPQGKKKGK